MEPVKGGTLANLPKDAAAVLKKERPDQSEASWALRFAASVDNDIIAILSGMSNLGQMQDNIETMSDIQPLSETEKNALNQAIHMFLESRPISSSEINKFTGLTYQGVLVTSILDAYSTWSKQSLAAIIHLVLS